MWYVDYNKGRLLLFTIRGEEKGLSFPDESFYVSKTRSGGSKNLMNYYSSVLCCTHDNVPYLIQSIMLIIKSE